MEQSPSLEANSHSTNQKFPAFYGTRTLIWMNSLERHCWY